MNAYCVYCGSDKWGPLKGYLASLDKILALDIKLIFPGHKDIIKNSEERIQELKHCHQERLDEIISILGTGSKTAFQVGSQMTWYVNFDSWGLFPALQKWLAIGEVIAHLKCLEGTGGVKKEKRGATRVYSLI